MADDTLRGRLRHTAAQHLDDRRMTSLRLLLSFGITFGLVRALTYAIHVQLGPFHDIVTGGGLHIHHYVWGIALVLVSGFLALNHWLQAARDLRWGAGRMLGRGG